MFTEGYREVGGFFFSLLTNTFHTYEDLGIFNFVATFGEVLQSHETRQRLCSLAPQGCSDHLASVRLEVHHNMHACVSTREDTSGKRSIGDSGDIMVADSCGIADEGRPYRDELANPKRIRSVREVQLDLVSLFVSKFYS